jgi:gamma-glutamyl:cysteine ligase YbdK (ATP-grasp superfamily)
VRAAVEALIEPAEPAAQRLGCEAELALVSSILERGNGADEQRAAYEEDRSLLAVAQQLAGQTVAGL